jgi:hydroxyquinol 1,2-dioxygenase
VERVAFREVKPNGVAVIDDRVRPWRPAHVHFMISAPGFEQLVTDVFVAGDKNLDSDVVFGVKDRLIHDFVSCPPGRTPDGRMMDAQYFHLNYDFGLKQVASGTQAA